MSIALKTSTALPACSACVCQKTHLHPVVKAIANAFSKAVEIQQKRIGQRPQQKLDERGNRSAASAEAIE